MSSSQPWGQLTARHWEELLSEGQHLPLSVPGGMALGSLAQTEASHLLAGKTGSSLHWGCKREVKTWPCLPQSPQTPELL